MSRLFLIRRESEKLVGPLTIEELRDAFDKMEFGIADEISGHLGPWVTIENKAELQHYYPSVFKIFNPGDRTRATKRTPGMTEDSFLNEIPITKKKQPVWFYLSLFLITVAGVAISFVAFQRKKAAELKSAEYYTEIFRNSGTEASIKALEPKIGVAINHFNQKKLRPGSWLPLFRLYAFHHSGYLRGVSPDLLKGRIWQPMPKDCSSASWIRRIKQMIDSPHQFSEDKISKVPWFHLVAMDPYWVKRRKDSSFLSPQNYYQACTMTAKKAIASMKSIIPNLDSQVPSAKKFLQIASRVDWIDLVIQGRAPTRMDMPENDEIRIWTCLEQELSFPGLKNCLEIAEDTNLDSLTGVRLNRFKMNVLRVAIRGDSEAIKNIVENPIFDPAKSSIPDVLFRYPIEAEKEFLIEIRNYGARNPGGVVDIEQIKQTLSKKYPSISF